MPIVSKTTQGEKQIVNIVFLSCEDGVDECYQECVLKFGKQSEAKPTDKNRPVKKAKGD